MNPNNRASQKSYPQIDLQKEKSKSEILTGLMKAQKEIHPKFLYDQFGSELFEEICKLEEYYPSRTETSILNHYCQEISQFIGDQALLIEFGAGASIKTRILLRSLEQLAAYLPIDISRDFLLGSAAQLQHEFPQIKIFPLSADYTCPIVIPVELQNRSKRKVGFFPGSTFGNFDPPEALSFLKNVAKLLGPSGLFLIGIDLIKDRAKLERAYNDSRGITAAFNLNILSRMNRELNANFNLESFFHRAHFNLEKHRIEMHIVSKENQLVTIAGQTLAFKEGETIHTESSYKFYPQEFENFVETVGFSKLKFWTDPEEMFAVYLLEV